MKITYTLDGKTVTPDEIKGKSGKVTIRFDYTNNEKRTVKIDGKDTAIIKNLAFNSDYYSADDMFMRPGGSCLAEFEPIKVTEIKLTISRKLDDTGEGGDEIRVSDIVVLSKKEA